MGLFVFGEKLNCRDCASPMTGEFCCCRMFVLSFGEVDSFGEVEMTLEGDDGELLVPPLSFLKLLKVRLRQDVRTFGSLFSLFSEAKGFPLGTVEVVGV